MIIKAFAKGFFGYSNNIISGSYNFAIEQHSLKMDKVTEFEKKFTGINASSTPLRKGEYDRCNFMSCDFSSADLANIIFGECTFSECNLSLARITQTAFRDVNFKSCKLLGLQFFNCNQFMFAADFESCNLTLSSFFKLNLKKRKFKDCILNEVDFSEADLTQALFFNCDLDRATFKQTNLEKADLSSARNFSIDPELNKVKKTKFALTGLPGLLHKYNLDISF